MKYLKGIKLVNNKTGKEVKVGGYIRVGKYRYEICAIHPPTHLSPPTRFGSRFLGEVEVYRPHLTGKKRHWHIYRFETDGTNLHWDLNGKNITSEMERNCIRNEIKLTNEHLKILEARLEAVAD